MKTYEFEGKTTEEAINNAAREMNIPPEELEFEIIEPGSAGIFGLVGTRKTRIRVNVQKDEEIYESNGLEIAKETLENILALIPIETTVTGEQSNSRITLTIEGDTSGLLIGRKGKTLDALQYIVNRAVNKAAEKKLKVVVDSENYRQRRIDSLTQMALKIGDKAMRLKKTVSTNPLNPHDRRIVHLTLKDNEKLETRSRGEGLHKRVLIIPKR
jgi:spoIIIJ-associated protein